MSKKVHNAPARVCCFRVCIAVPGAQPARACWGLLDCCARRRVGQSGFLCLPSACSVFRVAPGYDPVRMESMDSSISALREAGSALPQLTSSAHAFRARAIKFESEHLPRAQRSFLQRSSSTAARMEGDGFEPEKPPSSSSGPPTPHFSPIDAAGRSSPQCRESGTLASKKRSASQLFNFGNDDLGAFHFGSSQFANFDFNFILIFNFNSSFFFHSISQCLITLSNPKQTPQSSSRFFPTEHFPQSILRPGHSPAFVTAPGGSPPNPPLA